MNDLQHLRGEADHRIIVRGLAFRRVNVAYLDLVTATGFGGVLWAHYNSRLLEQGEFPVTFKTLFSAEDWRTLEQDWKGYGWINRAANYTLVCEGAIAEEVEAHHFELLGYYHVLEALLATYSGHPDVNPATIKKMGDRFHGFLLAQRAKWSKLF